MPELVMLPNNLHDPHSLHRVALADSRPTWLSLINCWLGSPSLINDPPYLTMNIRTLSNNACPFSALLILWCDALPHNINRFGKFTRVRYVVWMPPSCWYNIDNDNERDSWDVPAPVVKAWGNSEWQSKSKETSRQDPRLSSRWASPSRVPPPIDDVLPEPKKIPPHPLYAWPQPNSRNTITRNHPLQCAYVLHYPSPHRFLCLRIPPLTTTSAIAASPKSTPTAFVAREQNTEQSSVDIWTRIYPPASVSLRPQRCVLSRFKHGHT